MSSKHTNNRRIYKNTAVLYVRMIVVMLISLYSSRIVLQALGADDFGLYNVVGGVVGLMIFFNTTMAKTTQRFLNVAMVKGNESLCSIFESSITVHLMFAALFLLLGETMGLWFLNTYIRIPEYRIVAANIVYQASLFSFCVSIIMTPYNAVVVAYEKMTFVAAVSIIDAVLKLAIALSILSYNSDRLSVYGILLLGISLLNFIMYFFYCKRRHPLLKFRISTNKENFRKIFGFVSWTLLGQFAIVGCNHGNVVMVNLFHSLIANSAMAIGSQVNHAITNLTSNFQTAFNPQITKSYAEGDFIYLRALVYSTSKISFFILFVVVLPIAFNIDWILELWLGKVPPFSNVFAILFMINGILNALSSPFNFTVLSSSNIRNYQIVVSLIFLLDLPIVYFLFAIGFPPATVLIVKIAIMSVAMFARICFASKLVPTINASSFVRSVLLNLFLIAFISVALAVFLEKVSTTFFERFFCTILLEIVCLTSIMTIGLDRDERKKLIGLINNKCNGVF